MTAEQLDQIEQLEDAWRRAFRKLRTAPGYRVAEQQAWDELTEAKVLIDQCFEPGCRKTVPDFCYCKEHQP